MRIQTKKQIFDSLGNGSLKIGPGMSNEASLKAFLGATGTVTATINVPADASHPFTTNFQDVSLTVTGAGLLSDVCLGGVNIDLPDTVDISCFVSGSDQVTIRLRNWDTAAWQPAGGPHTFKALVICL